MNTPLSCVTMITPYKKDGSIDYETAKKYVKYYYENGCDSIFSVCQSSEIFFMTVNEKEKLNKVVYETAKSLSKDLLVFSSGHTSYSLDEQAHELNKVAQSGTDALILITNRLDVQNEGDEVWIKNAEKLLSMLPSDVKLGLYECPYPYKRLVTPKILKWCLETDRFYYMKDTSCNIDTIKQRMEILRETKFKLLNANAQTLLESMRLGGGGYCGAMCNFHPKLYAYLCKNFEKETETVEMIQAYLSTVAFTLAGLPYPLTAKYNMCLENIETCLTARNRNASELTDYAKDCIKQMRFLSNNILNKL